jgi:hypothetical protein
MNWKTMLLISSGNSGSFSNALSLLRRNLLIIEDGGLIKINPDL